MTFSGIRRIFGEFIRSNLIDKIKESRMVFGFMVTIQTVIKSWLL